MPYAEVIDFKGGLDRRRPPVVGEPGTLYVGKNIHLTRGGDVEGRLAFVPVYHLPPGTFGLHSLRGKFYVFGSGAAPSGLPADVIYQQLQHPDGKNMTALLDVDSFDGKVYAVARYEDGSIHHFYDGVRVSEWDNLSGDIADIDGVALYLAEEIDAEDAFFASAVGPVITITAAEPGTAFTISTSATGSGGISRTQLQANVPGVDEVVATGGFEITGGAAAASNYIDSVTVDGVELIDGIIFWTLSNEATADLVRDAINEGPTEYTATSSGAVVTIHAPPGTGSAPNGYVVTVGANGLLTVGNIQNMDGGVDAVEAVAQIEEVTLSNFDTAATWTITLNGKAFTIVGQAAGMGRNILTYKSKMYASVRSLLHFSAVDTPTSWVDNGSETPDTGLGYINVANQDRGSELITGLGVYQSYLAVFSQEAVQIWDMDPDPDLNVFVQPLQNTGTRSPGSVIAYGNTDLFYLDRTGIRSLRARDSSNAAYVNDVGTAIDPLILEHMDQLTEREIAKAQAVIEPKNGRFWLALGDVIYVFSYFPASKISAWSTYEPGFAVDHFAVSRGIIFARSGDTIYAYGGLTGDVYPKDGEVEALVQLPFLDFNRPATEKQITGIDIASKGTWECSLLYDPNNEATATPVVRLTNTTYAIGRIDVAARCTHVAPRFRSTSGGHKLLSSVVVHFESDEAS